MKKLEYGVIVKNKAGRDKETLSMVLRMEGGYAYVVDGKGRRIEHPKKKNPKHLQATGATMQITINQQSKDIESENAKIRQELRRIGNREVENV